MDPDLIPASKDDEPILADLLELYSHELRDIANLTPGADGRFGYPPLPLYWTDPDREPFLFRVGGELAGFVLVRKGSVVTGAADVWDVAEFFVLRPYRRQGAGGRAAHKVWRGHPGR